jgi:protein-L-isoaspartate(D-aspartate) O-methyltransferase
MTPQERMIEEQIKGRGINGSGLLNAFSQVPRQLFVADGYRSRAYEDAALPLGYHQTISQPYMVGLMTSLLNLGEDDDVLEVGTGSGYQTAIISRMARSVCPIEINAQLSDRAQVILRSLGYDNIQFEVGDGRLGWSATASFDAVIVTAAPETIPPQLVKQLRSGGRMVIPVGVYDQYLYVVQKTEDGVKRDQQTAVRFVPLLDSGCSSN